MVPANSNGLKRLVEKTVYINRGGPESRKGWLVAVKDDHLVLLAEERYLYYLTKNIKSVSVDSIEPAPAVAPFKEKLVFLDAENFIDVLKKMSARRIQINQGGPECVDGVLGRLFENHLDLIEGHEVIKVALPHIKSVSFNSGKTDENSNKESQAEQSADNNETNEKTNDKSKEQTTSQEAKRSEVNLNWDSKGRISVQEPRSIPIVRPLIQKSKLMANTSPIVQNSKPIEPVNSLRKLDSDSIKVIESTDVRPVMADNSNQDHPVQIVEDPSHEVSFLHNPVPNLPEAVSQHPVIEQSAEKSQVVYAPKFKLKKRNRRSRRTAASLRRKPFIKPRLLRASKAVKKIKKLNIVKERYSWSKKRKTTKSGRPGLLWLAPSMKEILIPR